MNTSSAAYAYVDCTPLDKTNVLDKQWDDNGEKGVERQVVPGDWPLYFQLEKDDNKAGEVGMNESSEAYDGLDRTAEPGYYRENGDEGAYQHIELQTIPVGNDQEDYQHLSRSGFR